MGHTRQLDQFDAQQRRIAVHTYRAGKSVKDIARKLKRSLSWVYKWIAHQAQHPWTRFRSGSRASHSHPNQTPTVIERRVIRLRQQLVRRKPSRLRFAGIGARTIQREYRKRYGPPPSLSTIQRILNRNQLIPRPSRSRPAYRPHPAADYPNVVQATDIITRWITGGEVVQTFNTVDLYSNNAGSTTCASKSSTDACQHLFHTWKTMGVPDLAQFDNESAFSGGRHPRVISQVVRLCLYFGVQVLFIPLGEADYNWPVETFNELWAKRFWDRHHFSRRRDIPRVQCTFLNWYRTDYIAPRQSDTPVQLQHGFRIRRLPARWAENLPDPLPICVGQIHAVRLVSDEGYMSFLNEPIRVGKRYRGRYVWLTLDTGRQNLTIWYQPRAEADWQQLKELDYLLNESVVPVPEQFARLHI
jgi:transposase